MMGDDDIMLTVYGVDPETQYLDGAYNTEVLDFDFYDASFFKVRPDVVLVPEDNILFEDGGFTALEEMWTASEDVEARIAVDPLILDFGPVHEDEEVTMVFTVMNTGGDDLTVFGVGSDLDEFWVDFGEEDVIIGTDESIELELHFSPSGVQSYQGIVTVFNDDPDVPEQEMEIAVGGTGSDIDGHFQWFLSGDVNHQVLAEAVTFDNFMAEPGDEVGIFTDNGFCAGSGVVAFNDEGITAAGPTAFANAGGWNVEGFEDGEDFHFRFWDKSRDTEYTEGEGDGHIEINAGWGNLTFQVAGNTGLDVFNLMGVWTMSADGNEPEYGEGDVIIFDVSTVNGAPDNMMLEVSEWMMDGEAVNVPDEVDANDNGDNTLTFTWQTNNFDAGEYVAVFRAFDDDEDPQEEDFFTVSFVVNNENPGPEVDPDVRDGIFTWNDELERWEFEIEEGAGHTLVIPNLEAFWIHLDNMELIYSDEASDPDIIDQWTNNNQGDEEWEAQFTYWILADGDWFGETDMWIKADDLDREDIQGPVRNVRRGGVVRNAIGAATTTTPLIARGERFGAVRSVRIAGNADVSKWINPRRDDVADFFYTLIVNPVNDEPLIMDIDDPQVPGEDAYDFGVDEGDMLLIDLLATDPDNAGEDLGWAITDTDLPNDQTYSLTDDNDGSSEFEYTPGFDEYREEPYFVDITVSDGALTDAVRLNITVRNSNLPPDDPPGDPIEFTIDEDSGRSDLQDLSQIFVDPDPEDVLNLSIPNPPANLNAEIDAGWLVVTPTPNYHSGGESVEVVVEATDGEFTVSKGFDITVTSVNDGPDVFALVSPDDGHRIAYDPDSMGVVDFSWDAATQNGGQADNAWEEDGITYHFVFMDDAAEDTFVVPDLVATEYLDVPIAQMALQLVPDREEELIVRWWVIAVDDTGATVESTERRTFIIPNLEVRDIYGPEIPNIHFLSPNFPNPFNATTTVRFGLPTSGVVDVSVWDMHGRRVATLAQGNHTAGRYEAVWVGHNVTSGVYLIRMQSGEFHGIQKAILIK